MLDGPSFSTCLSNRTVGIGSESTRACLEVTRSKWLNNVCMCVCVCVYTIFPDLIASVCFPFVILCPEHVFECFHTPSISLFEYYTVISGVCPSVFSLSVRLFVELTSEF